MTHYLVTHVINNGKAFREDIVLEKVNKEDFKRWHLEERKKYHFISRDGVSCVNIFHHLRCDNDEERQWLIDNGHLKILTGK